MYMGMKSIVYFDPDDTQEERIEKFVEWYVDNHESAIGDKYVPGVEETKEMLKRMG